jgi:hypothetical protein
MGTARFGRRGKQPGEFHRMSSSGPCPFPTELLKASLVLSSPNSVLNAPTESLAQPAPMSWRKCRTHAIRYLPGGKIPPGNKVDIAARSTAIRCRSCGVVCRILPSSNLRLPVVTVYQSTQGVTKSSFFCSHATVHGLARFLSARHHSRPPLITLREEAALVMSGLFLLNSHVTLGSHH